MGLCTERALLAQEGGPTCTQGRTLRTGARQGLELRPTQGPSPLVLTPWDWDLRVSAVALRAETRASTELPVPGS